jgi:hypothetical protein
MGNEKNGRRARRKLPPLPPEAAARMSRNVHILLGWVPLPQMTQEEVDWLFRQKLRLGGDE